MAIQYPSVSPDAYLRSTEKATPNYADLINKGLQTFIGLNQAKFQLPQEEVKAQYAEPLAQMEMNLKNAQIQRALRPEAPVLSSYEKALQGLQRVKQQYGEGSPEAKQAQDYASRIAQGAQGMQLTVDPKTGAVNFSTGGRGQPMQQVITDENGNSYVINKPTTPTSTATQKGSLANFVRQNMAKNFTNPYVGTGSNYQILKDRADYASEKNPEKKKEIGERLINAALSYKLAPEYAALQLTAQGAPSTEGSRNEQRKALTLGWAESLPYVVNNLPHELQTQVNNRHDKTIEELNRAREQYVATGMPIKLENKSEQKKGEVKLKNLTFENEKQMMNFLNNLSEEEAIALDKQLAEEEQ